MSGYMGRDYLQGQALYLGIVPLASGRYYYAAPLATAPSTSQIAKDVMRAHPRYIPNQITIESLGGEVTSAGDVGSKIRFGIYADVSGRPGSLIMDAGTIAGDSVSVQEITGLSVTLSPGTYWFAAVTQSVVTTTPTVRTTGAFAFFGDIGTTAPNSGLTAINGVFQNSVSGSLPSTFNVGGPNTLVHRMFFKVQ